MLCVRTRLQPKHREPKNLKELLNNRYESTEQQYNSGHGVCEYMEATHSSQHTAPDAKHSSTRCCQTHEMLELPTPLIVANRSQQGDEVYGSYPLVLNRHPGNMSNTEHIQQCKAYTAASIIIHAQSTAVKQAHIRTSSLLCYNYYNRVPSNTYLIPAKPNTNTSSRTMKSDAYANRLQKGDVFAHLSSFTQASKISTKRRVLARGVQRYHSYFNRSYLPSAIGEDKLTSSFDILRKLSTASLLFHHYDWCASCFFDSLRLGTKSTEYAKLATGYIATADTNKLSTGCCCCLRLVAQNTASGNLCVATESTVASTAEISMQSLPAESLAQEQNAVVSTYVNDIVLLSLILLMLQHDVASSLSLLFIR
ncbi:putative LRR receptor-like serine/threonine-protein kinase [Dorcoceras hygrometricum]|uniref:Putative LRR receptor-like serine/threonine-protein kinase n=1 Tax=Dorcoceras hygrometricum TaxID=472368 RepID=A0A2Z7B9Q1_9LAMI|nr:putative LRR receptor-like serine/threonine-protein kinase [Dorcoceras hygrometricum]